LSASKLQLVFTSNWSNFWHAFASREFVSDSWAFLFLMEVEDRMELLFLGWSTQRYTWQLL